LNSGQVPYDSKSEFSLVRHGTKWLASLEAR
jgi:hypothetical protein